MISAKEYIDAADQLALLPYANDAEGANKAVYEIFNNIEQREKYILTDEEMETLQIIANECPFHYGQSVYSARVLINTQYGFETKYWEDDDLCIAGIDYRRSNPNSLTTANSIKDNDLMIYPNPASTELNFKIRNSNGCIEGANTRIEIVDILGNEVIKKDYDEFIGSGKLNITILANGAYVFKYSCGNNEVYRQSFVVNK